MIVISQLSKIYGKNDNQFVALDCLDFNLPSKGLVTIIGESGCGKTTLLNCLSGIDSPTSGTITGINKNECAFIFQDFQLIDNLTIKENLLLVNDDVKKIDQSIEEVGLKKYLNKKINQLSAGQKQRTAIARGMLLNKKYLFADEPTGNLDSKNSDLIFEMLKKISEEKLVVVVSHNETLAKKYSDRIIELIDGKIVNDETINSNDFAGECSLTSDVRERTVSFKKMILLKKADTRKNLLTRLFNIVFSTTMLFVIMLLLNIGFLNRENAIIKGSSVFKLNNIDFYQVKEKYNYVEKPTDEDFIDNLIKKIPNSLKCHIFQSEIDGVSYTTMNKVYTSDSFNLDLYCGKNPSQKGEIVLSHSMAMQFGAQIFGEEKTFNNLPQAFINENITINGKTFKVVGIDKETKTDNSMAMVAYNKYFYCFENDFEDLINLIKKNGSIDCYYVHSNDSTNYTKVNKSSDYIVLEGKRALGEKEVVLSQANAEMLFGNEDSPIGKTIDFTSTFNLQSIKSTITPFEIVGVCQENGFFVENDNSFDYLFKSTTVYSDAYYREMISLPKKSFTFNNVKLLTNNKMMDKTPLQHQIFDGYYFIKRTISFVLIIVAIPSIVLLIMFQFVNSTQHIKNNKRIIGILKTLSYPNKEIIKTFIIDALISILISLTFCMALSPLGINFINIQTVKAIGKYTGVLSFSLWAVLILFLVAVSVPIISLLISYYKLNKKSDVDLIYER